GKGDLVEVRQEPKGSQRVVNTTKAAGSGSDRHSRIGGGSPPGSNQRMAQQRLGRPVHRIRQRFLSISNFGAQILSGATIQQVRKLVMKCRRLGTEGLEFLSVRTKKSRDRRRHI